jgi:hypothetical protein
MNIVKTAMETMIMATAKTQMMMTTTITEQMVQKPKLRTLKHQEV